MKRILILANHEMVIYGLRKELVRELLEEGYEVTLAAPYGSRIQEMVQWGCHFVECRVDRHGMNIARDVTLLLRYFKLIEKVRPCVVLTYTIKPNIYGGIAAMMSQTPYMPNITGLGTAIERKGVLKILTAGLYKASLRQAAVIFVQNSENKAFFSKSGIRYRRFVLLPGSGVNLEEFRLLPYPDSGPTGFAFIARLMREKGIEEFIHAAEYMRKRYPDTRFHICGFCEEAYETRMREKEENGILIYHGMVDDIRTVLKEVSCVVLPSYHEGMSNALLEAAACGRPLIATDIPGCREIVDSGVNGFLVERASEGSLVKAMEDFYRMDWEARRRMGLASREKVEREFDRKEVIKAYMEEIKKYEPSAAG